MVVAVVAVGLLEVDAVVVADIHRCFGIVDCYSVDFGNKCLLLIPLAGIVGCNYYCCFGNYLLVFEPFPAEVVADEVDRKEVGL